MGILDLPRDQFLGAISELNAQGVNTDDLVREYRRQNSPFAAAYDWADRAASNVADRGREAGFFGLLSKPEGTSGMEAIRNLRLEPKNFAAGLLGGVAQAVDAPSAAAMGLIPSQDMPMEALNTAGMTQLGAAAMPAPDDALRMGAARRDPRLYHPASGIKLQRPVSEMEFGYDAPPEGFLLPERTVKIEDLEGKVLVPAFGDRTRAGGLLRSIMGEELPTPVELQGGADFMRSAGGIWASEPDAMATKAKHIERIAQETGEEPILTYTAMGAQAGDFSRMMSDAMMQQIRPSMANYIDPEAVARFDKYVRDKVDKDWVGILSPEASSYVSGMTGSNRRLLWQEMDKTSYRDAGFPDVGATRLAITDPRLIDAQPFDTGLTMGILNRGFEVSPTPKDVHSTYGAQIQGEYLGGLERPLAGDLVWRDFFNKRREAGAKAASDQRAFMMTPSISQRITGQQVDEISRYLEGLQR